MIVRRVGCLEIARTRYSRLGERTVFASFQWDVVVISGGRRSAASTRVVPSRVGPTNFPRAVVTASAAAVAPAATASGGGGGFGGGGGGFDRGPARAAAAPTGP